MDYLISFTKEKHKRNAFMLFGVFSNIHYKEALKMEINFNFAATYWYKRLRKWRLLRHHMHWLYTNLFTSTGLAETHRLSLFHPSVEFSVRSNENKQSRLVLPQFCWTITMIDFWPGLTQHFSTYLQTSGLGMTFQSSTTLSEHRWQHFPHLCITMGCWSSTMGTTQHRTQRTVLIKYWNNQDHS